MRVLIQPSFAFRSLNTSSWWGGVVGRGKGGVLRIWHQDDEPAVLFQELGEYRVSGCSGKCSSTHPPPVSAYARELRRAAPGGRSRASRRETATRMAIRGFDEFNEADKGE